MKQRTIKDGPFCWVSKQAMRLVRDAFDNYTFLSDAIAVYCTLAELASDDQSETFQRSRRAIAERAGVSLRQLDRVLKILESVNLLSVQSNQIEGSKEKAPSTYTLRTVCTTSCTPCTRLRTDSEIVFGKVREQTIEESEKKISDKASKASRKLSGEGRRLASEFEATLGMQWPNDAGKWINRIKAHPKKADRVIAEVRNAKSEHRISTTPAQYAEQIWKEFA